MVTGHRTSMSGWSAPARTLLHEARDRTVCANLATLRAVPKTTALTFAIDDGTDEPAVVEVADIAACGAAVHVINRVLEPCDCGTRGKVPCAREPVCGKR